MGNIKILSRAGYQDMSALRAQVLNSINSTTRMSYAGQPFDMTTFSVVEMLIFIQKDFQAAPPILSFTKLSGNLIPLAGGFFLSVPGATLDVEEKTYYYSLLADGELLLEGKFVIVEHAQQL